MGYSPWGHKESDMTEQLTLTLRGTEAGWGCCLSGAAHSGLGVSWVSSSDGQVSFLGLP